MDFLDLKEHLLEWLTVYGSLALFFLLALGIVGLPVPDETLLVLAGILMHKQKLSLPATLIASYAGTICGISMSYVIGRSIGRYALKNYGNWFGMTEQKLEVMRLWYHRLGKWVLFFGYFIPGVRHLSGFFAGMAHLKFREFALYAYSGALVWATFFLVIGYFLHQYWTSILANMEANIETLVLTFVLLWMFHWYYKKRFSR